MDAHTAGLAFVRLPEAQRWTGTCVRLSFQGPVPVVPGGLEWIEPHGDLGGFLVNSVSDGKEANEI
jgi:hypothetical protein